MVLESFHLNGKNALVTGSRRGLGAAIARALAQAGANVGCHGKTADRGAIAESIRQTGRKSFYMAGDLSDPKVQSDLIAGTIEEFGSIDILVNNAGAIRRAPALEYPQDYWDEVIGITVPAYAAAKGGVVQLTKALANEWASKAINVNAIAPGYMVTDNTTALRNDPVRSRQILERIPAGRWGEAEDIAGAAVFLCSSASDYIHGHVLVVDGGWLAR